MCGYGGYAERQTRRVVPNQQYGSSPSSQEGWSIPFANPGMAHLPCAVLLDTSGSMGKGGKINQLNQALRSFKDSLMCDVHTRNKVEVCLITFDSTARVVVPFCPVPRLVIPKLEPRGLTSMYAAVSLAIRTINQRREQYRHVGIPSYKPYLFLMTDGKPTDVDNLQTAGAFDLLMRLQREHHWQYMPIAIGAEAGSSFLMSHNADGKVMLAESTDFADLFEWISSSVTSVSHVSTGAGMGFADIDEYDDSPLRLVQLTIDNSSPQLYAMPQHSSQVICPVCRQRLGEGDSFCRGCGWRPSRSSMYSQK